MPNNINFDGSYKPFYFWCYDPLNSLFGKKSEKANYTVFFCQCSETCEARKNGYCFMKNGIYGKSCPYGKRLHQEGYTPKAGRYYTFINEAKKKYGEYSQENVGFINAINDLFHVGDKYVYLPLNYLSNYVNPIDTELGIIQENLIPKENFTVENIIKLLKFRPQALFGGVIRGYEEDLPKFMVMLRSFDKELYNKVLEAYPDASKYCTKLNYVGRRAYVKTLLPGKVKVGSTIMDWNGKVITGSSSAISTGLGDSVLTITPKDNTIVTIVDNGTVDEDKIKIKF